MEMLVLLANATVQHAMLPRKLVVLIAVLNVTNVPFLWQPNDLSPLQIFNASKAYLFLQL
jgi:hypothetical protein